MAVLVVGGRQGCGTHGGNGSRAHFFIGSSAETHYREKVFISRTLPELSFFEIEAAELELSQAHEGPSRLMRVSRPWSALTDDASSNRVHASVS